MTTTDAEPWIVLGNYTDDRGGQVPLGLPLSDLRLHATVLGTTGSGKSTFCRNLALQCFALGATVLVIEPHGDLCIDPKEGILAALPEDALGRVALVDLASPWPPQISLTGAAAGSSDMSVAVETAMRCISVVEGAGFEQAVKMRETLEHSLAIIFAVFGAEASMVHLQRFLSDVPYRDGVLARATDDVGEARDFWRRETEKAQGKKRGNAGDDALDVPLRRVGKFLRADHFRRSLALPPILPGRELRIDQMLNADEARMILVPLQSTKLGQAAKRVFGTLFMQVVANTFMARAELEAAARRTTVIIIDEFADIAGSEVGDIVRLLLAQARKYGAAIVLSTQFLNQLPGSVRDEVKSNTSNKIMLRVAGADDAKEAVANFGGQRVTEADMLSIERFCGYAQLMAHNQKHGPMSFRNLPPITWPRPAQAMPAASLPRRKPRALMGLPDKLAALHAAASRSPRAAAAIKQLADMTERDFRAVVKMQAEQQERLAAELLADPGLEPDPAQRAMLISRARYGLPWWMYEAQYKRVRF